MAQYKLKTEPLGSQKQQGNSRVVGAVHLITKKKVAIKVLCKQQGQGNEPLDVFDMRELTLRNRLQQVKSQGITKLIETFEDEQFVYVVTSFKNFGDLQTLMESNQICYLGESQMLTPARYIMQALGSIHNAGFLHNDIQPGNILINKDSQNRATVALDGFSRCAPIEISLQESIYNTEINQYSHLYLAPEVLQSNGAMKSKASDVWSFGVLLYVMACGRLPFSSPAKIIN